MGRNVGRLGNGLGCVPDRIYRGVSDWEDGLMVKVMQGAAIAATFICMLMHEQEAAAMWAFVVIVAAVADKWMEKQ